MNKNQDGRGTGQNSLSCYNPKSYKRAGLKVVPVKLREIA